VIQPSKGVFLSYASEDAGMAERICEALHVAGIEVWFDQSELRGGDAWDQKIRQQIRDCALFVPIISAHTQARPEGYFRLEWKLAVDRSHLMAAEKAFLVPVVVDATTEPEALVPTQFRDVQWTRIRTGEVPAAFVDRIAALLNQPVAPYVGSPERGVSRAPARRRPIVLTALLVTALVALVIAAAIRGGWLSQRPVPKDAGTASAPVATTPSAVSEKSVAVLPFADTSEKKDQEYFSDGLSEELIDLLGRVPGLRVPARTSSFYFKGKQATLAEIAKALSVTHVLEGSVRKSGQQLRITAELVRVADDTRIWSETFDRKLDDVFKVQDDIAGAVVKALKISLLAGQEVYSTPTANSEAYTMYLKGKSTMRGGTEEDFLGAQSYFERTVAIDPTFAPGWAASGDLRSDLYGSYRVPRRYQEVAPTAHAEVSRGLELDPNLPEAHLALGRIAFMIDLDWDTATRELSRTLELAPGNATAWRFRSYLAANLGDTEQQRFFAERAIANDPLDYWNYFAAGLAGYTGGRLVEGEQSLRRAIELNDRAGVLHAFLARLLVASGKPDQALDQVKRETAPAWRALAEPLALDALGRRKEADEALASAQALYADTYASQIALVYARRNDPENALKWLERSYRQHDSSPIFLRHDPMLKSLEGNPSYKALLHKMKLPQ
jgi:adenylate cyclase